VDIVPIPPEPWMVWTGIGLFVLFLAAAVLTPYFQDAWADLKERLKELGNKSGE
jgi:hypothetical protein